VSAFSRLRRRGRDERGITLVELLVGIIIMSIISTMVLMTWFSLSESYSFSLNSNNARDDGRQAISRLAREVRDAQARPAVDESAIVRARSRWVLISTTFNESGNDNPALAPHLVMYRLYPDGEIWRFEDISGNGSIHGVDTSMPDTDDNYFDPDEQQTGEGATRLAKNIVNDRIRWDSDGNGTKDKPSTPVFRYSRYLSDGSLDVQPTVLGTPNRTDIVAAEMRLLVDLNPSHSPVYADLVTSAQIRNQH
jgi:type II secretory pathway pseudopilin PulG